MDCIFCGQFIWRRGAELNGKYACAGCLEKLIEKAPEHALHDDADDLISFIHVDIEDQIASAVKRALREREESRRKKTA